MAVVTIRQLLDSGVHFGHQTRRWNPKMKRFILTERSGSHIIDLQQSLKHIDTTYDYVKETVAHGGTILFVGTKKQAQEAIQEQATRVGQPFVNQRWLGGLLTNFQTVSKRLARMKELEEIDFDDTSKGFTKKELLIQRRELVKLHKTLGGIRNLTKTPSAIWVVDAKREHLAVNEATKLGIPVIGILDTNADPDELQYPIPGNDDAIRSVGLLTRIIADAVAEGLIQRHQKTEETGNVSAVEPLAEWERELLEASETPQSTAERIEAVDQTDATPEVKAAEIAEIIAAEVPTEENDADAVVAEHEAAADPTLVPVHSPETDEQTEARIEAEEATPAVAEVEPVETEAKKPAAKKPAAAKPAAKYSLLTEHIHPDPVRNTSVANFSLEDVKTLRERLGTGMVDTKNALVEAEGDIEKAVEILRLKGAKGNAKRADRSTAEGLVSVVESATAVTMFELACETDFVAKNEKFIALAASISQALADSGAETVDAALAAKAGDATVASLIEDQAATLGEKVELRRIVRLSGEHFAVYLHRTSKDLPPQIGVVVSYTGDDTETARSIAQHISFADPVYLGRDDVPPAEVENERRIVETISREEGKPEAALPKIVEGRVGAFFKQVALLEQDYARDNKQNVGKVLADAKLTIEGFARFKVGA